MRTSGLPTRPTNAPNPRAPLHPLDDHSPLADCLLSDRRALRRQAQRLRELERNGQPGAELRAQLERTFAASRAIVAQRNAAVPRIDYPPDLPISERRDEIATLIERHQVVVLCGETGSGKSTQLPKICLELGRGRVGRIGHTQPRRIAARTLAARVSAELRTDLGGTIGYKVRFHDRVRPQTAVKLMTDGILLAEVQQDRFLNEYDTLIIDEAHERSLNIDFLLGYLRQLLPRRPDLKLIITSATIDPQRFSQHFDDAPIIEVSGRTWPVEVRYRPLEADGVGERDDAMQQAISDAVAELARPGAGRGDVLVFLSGEGEIRETAETLRKHHPPSTEVLPLYARQGPAEQARVFQPHGTRRVVLATNVAETSLTVPGIHYVIDPGLARISRYSHRTRVQRLAVERISQASANQRAGRCGRVAAGICIRLYSEDNYAERTPFTEPEIRRSNLAAVILQMLHLGFGEIETFPFIDPPDPRLISDGYRTLEELAAIDAERRLTPLGRSLARLPVDPRVGRMLLAASEHQCLREVLIIAAALSVQDPRERPLEARQAADEIHATFAHPESDFLGLLNLWHFVETERARLSRRKFQALCRQHFLSWHRLQEWRDVHAQLHQQMQTMGHRENQAEGSFDEVHRALLTGLLSNLGVKDEGREYEGARGSRFLIHPGSALARATPKWIVCAERVDTTRPYGRTVARVQPGWLEAAGAHLLKRSYAEPHWQSRAGQVAAFETVTLFGVTLVSRRRVNYGPINPAEAREVFLRAALTDGDFDTRAPFWRHNLELIESVRDLEAKSRRRDLLVDADAIHAFYAERVPSGIYSTPQFERWLRGASRTTPKLLHMRLADLMGRDAEDITAARFPDRVAVGASDLPLEYRFEPGAPGDGVTLVLPLALINQLSPERLEWLVPGLLTERVTALLRGLPKALRRGLVPIPDTAARVVARLAPSERPLIGAVAEVLRDLTGVQIPEDAWDQDVLPPHLRMKVRLVDEAGETLATGEDLIALKRRHGSEGGARFARLAPATTDRQTGAGPWERDGITRWDFGPLPEAIDLDRGGIRVRGYPALVDQGDSVGLRLLDARENAELAMRAGLRRLLLLTLGSALKALRRDPCGAGGRGANLARMQLQYALAPMTAPGPTLIPASADGRPPAATGAGKATDRTPPGADLAEQLLALVLDLTFTEGQPPIRDQQTFEQRLAADRARLGPTALEVCNLVADLFDRYQGLRKRLGTITQVNWMPAALDLRAQFDGLIYRGFLLQVPFARLRDYPRYLRAAEVRLERLAAGAARDQQWQRELTPWLERWRERSTAAAAAGRRDPRLEEIRWMLEELRVSLFAQQVGTAYPISTKRLAARWRELGL